MRAEIETALAALQEARQTRDAVDRDAEPRAWAAADLDVNEVAGELGNAVREALRTLGLQRDLSRALGGTGYALQRLAFDPEHRHVLVALGGGPGTLPERRKAGAEDLPERVRVVCDEFYSRTGVEVDFPYHILPTRAQGDSA